MLTTKSIKALCLSISLMTLSSVSASDCPNFVKALALIAPLITSASQCVPDPIEEQTFVAQAEAYRKNLVDSAVDARLQSTRQFVISRLMSDKQPWHEGSSACCLSAKSILAEYADMKWHNNCTLDYDWPIWMGTVVNLPVTGCASLACTYGCPVTAASIACCGFGIPCALKIFEQRQSKPENLRSSLDWLSCNTAWQERVASAAPRPMTMDDIQ